MIWYQDFNFDTISILYFENIVIYNKNDKYVNLIQAQEQNVNVQQGSLL